MSDKLREEIKEYLKKHQEQLPDFAKETQLTRLLQRALTELDKGRWRKVENELPPEGVEVQVKIKDSNPLTGEPDTHYDHDMLEDGVWYSEAEYEDQATSIAMPEGTHYTWPKVIEWKPID